jgi:uncharacterized membrane protein YagU involved in acid resistance
MADATQTDRFRRAIAKQRNDELLLGMAAGLVGGVVGSLAMNRVAIACGRRNDRAGREALAMQGGQVSKRSGWQTEPATVRAAQMLTRAAGQRRLSTPAKRRLGTLMHYLFGAGMGTLYAAAASKFPLVTRGRGAAFGTALWLAADEVGMPLVGLSNKPHRYRAADHFSSLAAHVVYGLLVDAAVRQGRNARRV